MKRKTIALLLTLLLLGGCTIRQTAPASETAPVEKQLPVTEPVSVPEVVEQKKYTLRYYDGDTLLEELTLPEGEIPPTFVPEGSAPWLGWQDETGSTVDPAAAPVTGDASYTAVFGETLKRDVYYMEAEHGIFRPDDALSRREAAMLLYALLPETPPLPETAAEAPVKIPDTALNKTNMNANTLAYEAAHSPSAENDPRKETLRVLSALIEAGFLPAGTEEDPLCSESPVEKSVLLAAVSPYFRPAALSEAESILSEQPSRLETAVMFNALLGRSGEGDWCCADLEKDSPAMTEARAACAPTEVTDGMALLYNGRLCCIEGGRILRDADAGTLHFGADGYYTSGSEELDALCRDAVMRQVNHADSRERQLRSLYIYVRDNFSYLRRNYYDRGEHGWETEEATHMLSTHLGNCYSFAAAFNELARAMGYDAHAISGMQGENFAPHGWVWIEMEDGIRYFYDVEAEYAALRDGFSLNPMFKMPWGSATVQWTYTFDWKIEGFHGLA